MKVLNEAIIGEYHFIVSDDYLVITLDGKEMVHLSYAEAQEVVPWLMSKLGKYQGVEATIIAPIIRSTPQQEAKMWKDAGIDTTSFAPGKDPLQGRSASQTVPMKVGNPELAAHLPTSNNTGQKIVGVEGVNLVKEMQKAGVPLLRK